MIQSKTKLLPSNRELAQMCSRAGISDAQEFFPADSGGFNSVHHIALMREHRRTWHLHPEDVAAIRRAGAHA